MNNPDISVRRLRGPGLWTAGISLLIFWCFLSGHTKASEYLFPLDIKAGISGTFGEYRGHRFHGGIDIRTNGKMGYPVRAAAEGEIFQIKHFVGADGKVLYLRHRNGQITVYAHLFEFMPEIENQIRKERQRLTKYGFRIWPEKPLRVKKGAVIGYSGKSGTSSPHLHFEIRTPENQPVNPLKNGLRVDDIIPPVLKSVILEPADPYSAIEGGFASQRFRFTQWEGEYILSRNPRVAGRVRIALEACDETTRGSCNGVYRIETYYRSKAPGLAVSFDKFSFSDNFKGLSIYRPGSNFFRGQYFYWLSPSACIPFLLKGPGPYGLKGIDAREHLLIKVYDAANNYAVGKILFEEDHRSYDFSDRALKYSFFIQGGRKKILSVDEGFFKLEFSPESLCGEDNLTIQKKGEGKGIVYSVRFQHNSSAKPIKIYMKLTRGMFLDKIGIYARTSGKQGWRFLPTVVDRESLYAISQSVLPADFTLKRDYSKPAVGPEIYYGKARNLINLKRYEISFSVYDYGSGLDPDSIIFRVDNEPVLWELNYPEKWIYCYLLEPLPPGRHKVFLKVADYMGNVSEFRGTFLAVSD